MEYLKIQQILREEKAPVTSHGAKSEEGNAPISEFRQSLAEPVLIHGVQEIPGQRKACGISDHGIYSAVRTDGRLLRQIFVAPVFLADLARVEYPLTIEAAAFPAGLDRWFIPEGLFMRRTEYALRVSHFPG